jgi:hypothetical protein
MILEKVLPILEAILLDESSPQCGIDMLHADWQWLLALSPWLECSHK